MWPLSVATNHPSRRPLRGLLRMRLNVWRASGLALEARAAEIGLVLLLGVLAVLALRRLVLLGFGLALFGRLVVLLHRRLLERRLDVVEQLDLGAVLLHD